jgi:hypothetical protein
MGFLFHRSGVALAMALFACSPQQEPKVIVDCAPFEALAESRLTLEAGREAYRRAEERRMLRYQEALDPGYLLRVTKPVVEQSKIDKKRVCYEHLFSVGRMLFEHEYSFADGLGRDDARTREDPFRKVHEGHLGGPETISCTSCHWRGGPAGAGAVQDNSLLFGDGVNITSAEERNPPALQGVGVVQALAQEISAELQAQRDAGIKKARSNSREERVELASKGVRFGALRIDAKGQVDTSELKGVDPDLIIKPFGWRGEFATIRDFVATSTNVHLGIQSEDLLAEVSALPDAERQERVGKGPKDDPDNDSMKEELSAGQLTALIVYLASLELPIVAPPPALREAEPAAPGVKAPPEHHFFDRFSEGQRLFSDIGCALCHKPMMVLKDPTFRTTSRITGKTYTVDLTKAVEAPRLVYNEQLGGYPVWLFSDMRRHDMGPEANGKHAPSGLGANEYLSRRLWGLAGSPPYFYDGRAPSLDMAIEAHGGEAAFARDEFVELTTAQKGSLRMFLLGLRRAPRLIVP